MPLSRGSSPSAFPMPFESSGSSGSTPARRMRRWRQSDRGYSSQLVGSVPPASSLDHRITRAIEWILPRIEEPLTLGQAADVACLSESRFSHLFAEETGLPFRTWVLWRRLMRSVELMAAGETLTSAAHQAGFSDSAHFSRTFLRMFGVQASALGLV